MRINKYVAQATGLSRRAADSAIQEGRVSINGHGAGLGSLVDEQATVTLDEKVLTLPITTITVLLNKPAGYVVSRNGQGSKTVYDLLPSDFQSLKPVGRLDKDSSGLLLLTSDGALAQELTHPAKQKNKLYEVRLDKPLEPLHQQIISDHGIKLEDGYSRLILERRGDDGSAWLVTMHEGRNRQIRRTFATLGYDVRQLHRLQFGDYTLGNLKSGAYTLLKD